MSVRRVVLLSFALLFAATSSLAQSVFVGDPVDAGTGLAYPMMPGLSLVLPGDDEDFGTADDVRNTGLTGDVDLVVRSGTFAGATIPPPALAVGGAPIASVVAGGGSTGQGAEAPFTVVVSDGAGTYGNVLTGSDLDLRPVTVYAFADLDGDGVLGPTGADGTADDSFELQEVTAYAGRQMGTLFGGEFSDSLGLEIAAPASLGGLTVGLVAGAYTGNDAEALFTDGTLVLTRWPFFPPLDPQDLLGGGAAPSPDPAIPTELEWDTELNWIPAAGDPLHGQLAVDVDGSEPTTDQLLVRSAAASTARVFAEPSAAAFLARARPRLRVAPVDIGSGRALVLPIESATLASDGAASQLALRVLPVDLFANVADPAAPITVTLAMSGSARIASPDTDADARTETLTLADAAGETIVVDDDGAGNATLTVSIAGRPVESVALGIGAASDFDGDGVADDGNASAIVGDEPCDAAAVSCDDNCPRVINPSQVDSNHDGLGDCCDGTCVHDPLSLACDECALPATPTSAGFDRVRASVRLGDGTTDDKVTLKADFTLPVDAVLAPDTETLSVVLTQSGSDGFAAALAGLMTDLLRPSPSFAYADRDGAVDGVTKAQLKKRSESSWRLLVRASAPAIAGLAAGGADFSVMVGDDLVSGTLSCTGTAPRLRCELLP